MSERKCYLGDGVYADVLHETLILTTEDGIEVTNTIYLEPEVMERLREYLEPAGKESISSKAPKKNSGKARIV